jgi:hypothetical protein
MEKKFALCATKKIYILNLVLSERKILNEAKNSDLLHLHCGTASQIISGLEIASLNSRVFCSPGMGPNVAVLHVDD